MTPARRSSGGSDRGSRRGPRLGILIAEPTKLPDWLDAGSEKERERPGGDPETCRARGRGLLSSEWGRLRGGEAHRGLRFGCLGFVMSVRHPSRVH